MPMTARIDADLHVVAGHPSDGDVGDSLSSMNTAWAEEKLQRFVSIYEASRDSHVGNRHDLYQEVVRRTHTTIKIVETLGLEAPEMGEINEESFQARLSNMATVALGVLDDRDELDRNLRPTAPAIAADQLHPWVWDAARTFCDSKHYRAAVQQAALSINVHLQDKVDRRDTSDDRLVSACFSEKGPDKDNPRLRIPDEQNDQTIRSIQHGAGLFAMGCVQVIRNPAAHEHGEWPIHIALERLAALSVLARLIEESRVVRLCVSELDHARKLFFEQAFARLAEEYPSIRTPRTKAASWWSWSAGRFASRTAQISRSQERHTVGGRRLARHHALTDTDDAGTRLALAQQWDRSVAQAEDMLAPHQTGHRSSCPTITPTRC
jgi:hypothetical protein